MDLLRRHKVRDQHAVEAAKTAPKVDDHPRSHRIVEQEHLGIVILIDELEPAVSQIVQTDAEVAELFKHIRARLRAIKRPLLDPHGYGARQKASD
jgi:hypothetical protein